MSVGVPNRALTRKPCPSRKHSQPAKAIQDTGFYTLRFNERNTMRKPHNPVITCKDGFTMSVQARDGAYCTPRSDYPDTPYTHVECGYPSSTPITEALRKFAECVISDMDYTDTVYGYVPTEVVQAELDAHGGIVEGCMPSNQPSKEDLVDSYFDGWL